MADSEVVYLNCPFAQKDEAKELGARWNQEMRKWYVPPGADKNLFKKWLPNAVSNSPNRSQVMSPKYKRKLDHYEDIDDDYETFESWKEDYIAKNDHLKGYCFARDARGWIAMPLQTHNASTIITCESRTHTV